MALIDTRRRVDAAAFPDWFKARHGRAKSLTVARWVPIVMVGIPVLVLVAIVVYPTIWMFYHSLHNTVLLSLAQDKYSFIGLDNFGTVLSSDRFANSAVNLITFLVFGTGVEVVIGTALALMLYSVVRVSWLRVVLIVVLVMPMMLPQSMTGLIWLLMLTPSNGIVNKILFDLGLISQHVEWFSSKLSLYAITLTDVWQWTSLPLLIIYAGRVSLPPAVYEAARVDGAPPWRVLTQITLPMLKEVIAIAFILRLMDAYKSVDYVFVMTAGGPGQSSELPAYIAYQRGIKDFQVGEAAAYSIIIFAVAAVLVTLFLKYLKKVLKARGIA